MLDDEENEDEDEEDMSEDVTSSGSWWQVWEGVGSMIPVYSAMGAIVWRVCNLHV